ncbi:hypothetical protein CEXT_386891 [Caerostris extrusa]|uniref:Uncharacterized protein n=1 Tax=Caerostris extrusa TaxID=172846 RepID=A0AAV4P7K2_CAEEX|nr:hypothetical protein CEXT_386891 [Caerostris extrusa]
MVRIQPIAKFGVPSTNEMGAIGRETREQLHTQLPQLAGWKNASGVESAAALWSWKNRGPKPRCKRTKS